jgi:hypothetical protein
MDDKTTDRVLGKIFHRGGLQQGATAILPRLPLPPLDYNATPIPRPPTASRKRGARFMFAIARFIFNLGGTPFWEKHLTTLFYGPRSQGKSLHQAKTVYQILKWLDALYRFYPDLPQAIVVSNQKFNATIEKEYLDNRLFYWESIQQLKYCPRVGCWKDEYEEKKGKKRKMPHRLHNCYVIIDDAATIIPADGWQDLPRWFRKLWAQAGHNGVHAVANIQDPVSCDINFRRYTDLCFKFQKIMGNRRPDPAKPPVRWVWGIYSSREIPAEELWIHGDMSEEQIQQERIDREEQENAARAAGKKIVRVGQRAWKRRFHLIRRSDTEIYDTLQNVPEYMPNSLEHIELKCIDPNCRHVNVRHRVI